MRLQLNDPGSDKYKAFPENGTAPNKEQMPLLIAEGRTPLSAVGFMNVYLEVWNLIRTAPERLKHTYYARLKALEKSFDLGDGVARHNDGSMKIFLDAPYIRGVTLETSLVRGEFDLSDIYTDLVGEAFSQKQVDKYCGRPQSRDEGKQNPVGLALARGDKELYGEFVDARFTRTTELFNYQGKMMPIHAPQVPKKGAYGRLWAVDTLDDGNSSGAFNSVHLGYSYGRLIGVAPEAPRRSAGGLVRPTLVQRI